MSLRPCFAWILPLALVACTGNTTAVGGPSPTSLDDQEKDAIAQLNLLRGQAGLSPVLAVCTSLNVSASTHSDDMRDRQYLSDMAPDGSTVRTRACAAGYTPACSGSIPMAELVAEGYGTGAETVTQWSNDPTAGPITRQSGFLVVGIGRSIGTDNERWTLDLSSMTDASCN